MARPRIPNNSITKLASLFFVAPKTKRAAEESRGPKSQMQIVLLFDPSLKNAQEKLEYDLPESARSYRDFSLSRRRAVRVNHCSHRSVKSLSVPPRGP